MVKEYKTISSKVKGKFCHFQKHDFIRHGLSEYYFKNPHDINLEELKDKVVAILKKEGFVFFDQIEYKYITYYGKLAEFAVNYRHIV